MAGKKKAEIALQRELETQEEWEECLAMEGMWVVDVYQEWCGPCQALLGTFKRLKNELGDSLLNFAVAKADTIDALEVYRGRCEPTFLFYAGGILVSFVHGANAPKIQRVITEQLAQEHKVLEGQGERKEVKDTVLTRSQEKELQKAEEAEAEREMMVPKGCTLSIIKPDAVAEGKADEIMKALQEKGIEIVAQEDRELTDDEARELYDDLSGESHFDELIKFMTSGPSRLLVLTSGSTGETIVTDVRELLGPADVEQAKEEAPNSFRAKYGDKGYMNAIHASSSSDMASKEMAFFFPNLALPTYLKKKENIQRTLALIRPEVFAASKEEVIERIQEAGFTIALHKEVKLTLEQAEEFYKEHQGSAYFQQLTTVMSSGPLLALGLARDEAITEWRKILGPANIDDAQESFPDSEEASLRAKYTGVSGLNQFHGSDSEDAAKAELNYFFPMQQTVAVIKPSGIGTKDAIIDKIHEAGFRIAAQKETTITKDIVDMLYPEQQENDYYNDLVDSMTSGNTMFMVLTREGAVDGWRDLIGPTDPAEAKTKDKECIRAKYATDILNNAVHGSSNYAKAKEEVKAIFGDMEFNDDGTVKGEEPMLDKAEVDTTDITANTTQDMTAADATTAEETTAADESQGDTTIADTTVADTTVADTTVADTTVAETTEGDTTEAATTEAPTAEPAQEEQTTATTDDTAQESTEGGAATEGQESTVPDSTVPETTVDETQEQTTAKESSPAEQQEPESSDKPETEKTSEESDAEKSADKTSVKESADESSAEKLADEVTPEKPADEATSEKPADEASPEKSADEATPQKSDDEPSSEKPSDEASAEKSAEEQNVEKPADEPTTNTAQSEAPAAEAPAAEAPAAEAPAAEATPAEGEKAPEAEKTEEAGEAKAEESAEQGGDKPAADGSGEVTTKEGNTTAEQTTEG